ncbi:MAG: endonuclease/exonuclease/phosphatase family protein, partial [Thermoplasmatota archaeon]
MSATPLRAMTFNLRRRKVSDGNRSWRARWRAAGAVVRSYAPHVLGTQEGLPDQVGDLARGLPHYAFLGAGRMADGRDERNAIF